MVQGSKGDVGLQGPKGVTGATGPQGIPGPVNIANNLNTTAAGFALDARQGKILQDVISQMSNSGTTSEQQVYRFPNGLQICCSGVATYGMTWDSVSGGYKFDFTFKKPFAHWPRVFPSIFYAQGFGNVVAYCNATTTGFTAMSKLQAQNLDYMWVAIGYWK